MALMPANRTTPAAKRSLRPAPPALGQQQLFLQQPPLQAIVMSGGLQPTGSQIPTGAASSSASPVNPRKRRASGQLMASLPPSGPLAPMLTTGGPSTLGPVHFGDLGAVTQAGTEQAAAEAVAPPPAKKGRTNTPWSAEEEQRLKQMRDQGKSWNEIAKTFPNRTEGSVKKHWYKVCLPHNPETHQFDNSSGYGISDSNYKHCVLQLSSW
jgi:hypothetical protein